MPRAAGSWITGTPGFALRYHEQLQNEQLHRAAEGYMMTYQEPGLREREVNTWQEHSHEFRASTAEAPRRLQLRKPRGDRTAHLKMQSPQSLLLEYSLRHKEGSRHPLPLITRPAKMDGCGELPLLHQALVPTLRILRVRVRTACTSAPSAPIRQLS